MNTVAAQAIATALHEGLVHPGNKDRGQQPTIIALPMFRTIGPPPYRQAVEESSRLVAEAVIHVIENKLDSTIIPNTELQQLRDDNTRLNAELDSIADKLGTSP